MSLIDDSLPRATSLDCIRRNSGHAVTAPAWPSLNLKETFGAL
jgi:hypothetical protein